MFMFLYTILAGLALAEGTVFPEPVHAEPISDEAVKEANRYSKAIHVAAQLEKQGHRTMIELLGGQYHVYYW